MEQATRPAYESGPTFSKMSWRIIKEPLPDIARRSISGSNSAGIPSKLKSGDNRLFRQFKKPDAVKLFTARKIPIK